MPAQLPTIERRATAQTRSQTRIAHREAGDGDTPRVIGGYGAVFYNPADPGTEIELWKDTFERIMPGAFDRALREDAAKVVCLFNHDANYLLGRVSAGSLTLRVDETGLIYEATENSDDPQWQSIAAKVARGDLTGASFMFWVRQQTWTDLDDGRTIREITDVDLIEVGPVTFPWYASATAGMRTEGADIDALQRLAAAARSRRDAPARDRILIDHRYRALRHAKETR